jgi:hypothetical protein
MIFIGTRKSFFCEIAIRVGLIGDIKNPLKCIGDLQSVTQQLTTVRLHWCHLCAVYFGLPHVIQLKRP